MNSITNKFRSDFFTQPQKIQRKVNVSDSYNRPRMNFFSYDNKSDCDTSESDLESIVSADGQEMGPCDNPADFRLNSSWDVYFLRNDVSDWDERLVKLNTFNTIKGFWAIYQHIKLPSHLPQGCDYMIFRSGIAPCWENKENINGGRWMCELERTFRNEQLDAKWLETLLGMIGEQLDEGNQINGAVVQSRKKIDRISIWLRDSEDDYETKSIGHRYHELIHATGGLKFQTHESNTNRNSSLMRYKHVIY